MMSRPKSNDVGGNSRSEIDSRKPENFRRSVAVKRIVKLSVWSIATTKTRASGSIGSGLASLAKKLRSRSRWSRRTSSPRSSENWSRRSSPSRTTSARDGAWTGPGLSPSPPSPPSPLPTGIRSTTTARGQRVLRCFRGTRQRRVTVAGPVPRRWTTASRLWPARWSSAGTNSLRCLRIKIPTNGRTNRSADCYRYT